MAFKKPTCLSAPSPTTASGNGGNQYNILWKKPKLTKQPFPKKGRSTKDPMTSSKDFIIVLALAGKFSDDDEQKYKTPEWPRQGKTDRSSHPLSN